MKDLKKCNARIQYLQWVESSVALRNLQRGPFQKKAVAFSPPPYRGGEMQRLLDGWGVYLKVKLKKRREKSNA